MSVKEVAANVKNQGIYVSLDIGTTSIKVVVAEYIRGQLNIIGVGNEKSEGLSRGVIVDIDETVEAIKKAVKQAEQKANMTIKNVTVGIPSNQISIEPCHGMIAVSSENREITDVDVYNVIAAAKVRSVAPEREIISVLPEEFVVDGFDGIKDPRGMIGVRLELYASMITGPKTIVHNIKRCIDKAGLHIDEMVVQPLAISLVAMNANEREFGTILVDMGGGQTSVAVMHDHQLKFAFVDQEGGDLVTKDISVILNTSFENAERLKREYGYAISEMASSEEFFPVETIGKKDPVKVDEHYLAEIIEARLVQTLETVKRALDQVEAFSLPGGVVITGGASLMTDAVELARNIFGSDVRVYIPEQMGMRSPIFATSMGLIQYTATLDDIHRIAQRGKPVTSRPVQPVVSQVNTTTQPVQRPVVPQSQPEEYQEQDYQEVQKTQVTEKESLFDKIKNFFKMLID